MKPCALHIANQKWGCGHGFMWEALEQSSCSWVRDVVVIWNMNRHFRHTLKRNHNIYILLNLNLSRWMMIYIVYALDYTLYTNFHIKFSTLEICSVYTVVLLFYIYWSPRTVVLFTDWQSGVSFTWWTSVASLLTLSLVSTSSRENAILCSSALLCLLSVPQQGVWQKTSSTGSTALPHQNFRTCLTLTSKQSWEKPHFLLCQPAQYQQRGLRDILCWLKE